MYRPQIPCNENKYQLRIVQKKEKIQNKKSDKIIIKQKRNTLPAKSSFCTSAGWLEFLSKLVVIFLL